MLECFDNAGTHIWRLKVVIRCQCRDPGFIPMAVVSYNQEKTVVRWDLENPKLLRSDMLEEVRRGSLFGRLGSWGIGVPSFFLLTFNNELKFSRNKGTCFLNVFFTLIGRKYFIWRTQRCRCFASKIKTAMAPNATAQTSWFFPPLEYFFNALLIWFCTAKILKGCIVNEGVFTWNF